MPCDCRGMEIEEEQKEAKRIILLIKEKYPNMPINGHYDGDYIRDVCYACKIISDTEFLFKFTTYHKGGLFGWYEYHLTKDIQIAKEELIRISRLKQQQEAKDGNQKEKLDGGSRQETECTTQNAEGQKG